MRVLLVLVLAAAAQLLLTSAGTAAEEKVDWLALRGTAEDGKTQVNAFQAPWSGLDDGVADFKARKSPAPDAGGADYLQWKNSCVFYPRVIVGERLEIESKNDFAKVTPYLERQEATGERFLNALVLELSGEP